MRSVIFASALAAVTVVARPSRLDIDDSSLGNNTLFERDLEPRAPSGVVTTCKKSGTFALTFDDGPYSYGSSIVNNLNGAGAKATFFTNGNNWACIYDYADELVKRYNAGHLIGSHTWGHLDVTTLSEAQLNKQLDLVETAHKKILGIKPRFFRPPYGAINDKAYNILTNRGYRVINWNFDSGDSNRASATQVKKNYIPLYKKYPQPYIALNHETYTATKSAMPEVIRRLVESKYKLVTIAECLGESPYQSQGKASKRDSTWTCEGTPGPGEA